nr:SlyX family protein [Herbaspirillum robiniae]
MAVRRQPARQAARGAAQVSSEDRIIDIEMKLAHQEHLVDELNQTVYRQQKKIDELEMLLGALAKRFKELADTSQDRAAANEKPPHY